MRLGIWDIPNKVLCSGKLGVGVRVGDIAFIAVRFFYLISVLVVLHHFLSQ